jgi:hypothetical protein
MPQRTRDKKGNRGIPDAVFRFLVVVFARALLIPQHRQQHKNMYKQADGILKISLYQIQQNISLFGAQWLNKFLSLFLRL